MHDPSRLQRVKSRQRYRGKWRAAVGRGCLTALVAAFALVLVPRAGTARTWHVPGDAPTIQAGVDSAGVGDDVLVAPGTYFEHDIAMKSGIRVHSEQGSGATTVDAGGDGRGFDCLDLEDNVVIEGFTIVNGRAYGVGEHGTSGGGVRSVQSSLTLRDCVITDCEVSGTGDGGGVYGWESEVEIEACSVVNCTALQGGGIYAIYQPPVRIVDSDILGNRAEGSGGGILAMGSEVTIVRCVVSGNTADWGSAGGIGCESPSLAIHDCLITENVAAVWGEGSGLYASSCSGVIDGCTVASNSALPRLGTVYILGSVVEVSRTIVAFNDDRSIDCPTSQVTIQCCDVYGNTEGDDLCGDDLGGNFSEDPLFCDVSNGDYTVDACSPCLPGNHPHGVDCGLIGALGQGCGATPVEETSWGRVKALFR